MEFLGRSHEMQLLEREFERESSFVLMTGRRRVGKTRLIKEFTRGRNSLYFLATRQDPVLNLADFSEAMARKTGRNFGNFRTWGDAFRAFAGSGIRILALDEFQYVVNSDQSVLMQLQDAWDDVMSESGTMLILCGSHIHTMESLDKDYTSPLYGRFTRHIVVPPLSFFDVYDGGDCADAVKAYSVHGGIPTYMSWFDEQNLRDNVLAHAMDSTGMLYGDPDVILGDQVKGSVYGSIMRAIAQGNRSLTAISSALQMKATTLPGYLMRLQDMHMIRRDVPATESPHQSKNGLYSITDCYTAFWYRFVHPYASELSMGNKEMAIREFDRHFVESHVSFVYEDICRSMTRRMSDVIGFPFSSVGGYWSKNVEVDVLAVNKPDRKAFVAECKFWNSPVDKHVLNSLRAKAAKIDDLYGYDITFGLFSISGFEEDVMSQDVILVDGVTVVKGLSE